MNEVFERYNASICRALLEHVPDPVVLYDSRGLVLYLNPAFTRIFGWSCEELAGKRIDYVPGGEDHVTDRTVEMIRKGTGFYDIESKRITKDGRILDVTISGAVIRDENENPLFNMVIIRNITGTKLLESRLFHLQKMESIGTFASGIAHDFNNILQTIILNAELGLTEYGIGKDVLKRLRGILGSAGRGAELVRQILEFSRQDKEDLSPVDPSPIVKETLKMLRALIPSTVRIRRRIAKEPGCIMASPSQVQQIVMNLFANAQQALKDGRGEISVLLKPGKLAGMPGKKYILLEVADNGCGIDPGILDKIFDPYFTTKESEYGTGLGLAMVHGIVRSLDGQIRVASSVGEGTRFSVYFPRAEAETPLPRSVRGALPRGKERLLIVDDETEVLETLQAALHRLGYRVTAFSESRKALEYFKENFNRIDCVITDHAMPHLTGQMLAKAMLMIRPDIPIILCTGFSEAISEKEAKEMGIKMYLMKPVVIRQVAAALRKVLRKDPRDRQLLFPFDS